MKKQFLFGCLAILLSVFYAYHSTNNEKANVDDIDLVMIDSLLIDHPGQLYMIDLKEDEVEKDYDF
jgi:hypothetical protein